MYRVCTGYREGTGRVPAVCIFAENAPYRASKKVHAHAAPLGRLQRGRSPRSSCHRRPPPKIATSGLSSARPTAPCESSIAASSRLPRSTSVPLKADPVIPTTAPTPSRETWRVSDRRFHLEKMRHSTIARSKTKIELLHPECLSGLLKLIWKKNA